MNQINNVNDFKASMKYAYTMRLDYARTAKEAPSIGIVFGNQKFPSQCHDYLSRFHEVHSTEIHIIPEQVTAKVDLIDTQTFQKIFSINLNYDKNELEHFKNKTSYDSPVVLIFGFKHGCDYFIAGNLSSNNEDFSPIVLPRYIIDPCLA